jgi:hypothetical protein
MPYVKIDVCVNNCMIYYKQDKLKEKCDFLEKVIMWFLNKLSKVESGSQYHVKFYATSQSSQDEMSIYGAKKCKAHALAQGEYTC